MPVNKHKIEGLKLILQPFDHIFRIPGKNKVLFIDPGFPIQKSQLRVLGIEWKDLSFHTKRQNGVDIYTKGVINYPHATASFTLGIGVKTEGNLVISGTKGYVYVPAPWWLTSYFEVRYEDQTRNKKYFYSYDGEGLRYELQEFLSMIVNNRRSSYKLRRRESIAIADIIGRYRSGENVTEI